MAPHWPEEKSDKFRDIDDKTEGGDGTNATVVNMSRPSMPGLSGAMMLFHMLVKLFPAMALRGGAEDCDAAFNSLPLRADERHFNICHVLNPDTGEVNFFRHKAGFFGGALRGHGDADH